MFAKGSGAKRETPGKKEALFVLQGFIKDDGSSLPAISQPFHLRRR